jgi:hypothetical protein
MEAEELEKMAEEAREGKLDPFDRHIAMTMAIIAAILAVTTMLGHRAQTETLSLQEEANSLRTEANIYHTRASDQWAFYQAKNIRSVEYEGFVGLLDALGKTGLGGDRKSQELAEQWGSKVRKYEATELPQLKADAEKLVAQARGTEAKAEEATTRSHDAHRQGERFDLAELGAELALVLCSVAVLTKGKSYWYSGIAAGVVGVVIAISALLMA